MEANIVYSNIKDREFFDSIELKFPIFFNYINDRKEAYKLKAHWGAKKDPFIVLSDNNKIVKVFYSDVAGDNALIQFINYINNDCKN